MLSAAEKLRLEEAAWSMHANGAPPSEIAAALGISDAEVRSMIRRLWRMDRQSMGMGR